MFRSVLRLARFLRRHAATLKIAMNQRSLNSLERRGEAEELIEIKPPGFAFRVHLRCGTTDSSVYRSIFFDDAYRLCLPFVPENIVDCGGNIGLSAVYFAHTYPDAAIVVIEPELSNYAVLEKNIRPYPQIDALNLGIWNRSAKLRIDDPGAREWAFMLTEVLDGEAGDIDAISIDDVMSRFAMDHIDLLKVDIEGGEQEVFERNCEHWLPYTKAIVIELHDSRRLGCTKPFFRAMADYNYVLAGKIGECYLFVNSDWVDVPYRGFSV